MMNTEHPRGGRLPSTTASLVGEGVITPGDRHGCDLGFPTGNVTPRRRSLRASGSWAGGVVDLDDGDLLETHVLGFAHDSYGRRIRVEPHHGLRPMRAYSCVRALVRQLPSDMDDTRPWAARNWLHCSDA